MVLQRVLIRPYRRRPGDVRSTSPFLLRH